jgi:hypothetical protein
MIVWITVSWKVNLCSLLESNDVSVKHIYVFLLDCVASHRRRRQSEKCSYSQPWFYALFASLQKYALKIRRK